MWLLFLLVAIGVATQIAEAVMAERVWRQHRGGLSLDRPVDAAIVLGGDFDPDFRPSWVTRRRVQAGVALLQSGKAAALIFSGGGTKWVRPVAEMMRDHAIELGAPPDRLFLETESHSTLQNLYFSFPLAKSHGFERLALVSDAFHLTRAKALAAWMGHGDIAVVSVDHRVWHWRFTQIVLHVREALAWWFNLGKALAWEWLEWRGVGEEERAQRIK